MKIRNRIAAVYMDINPARMRQLILVILFTAFFSTGMMAVLGINRPFMILLSGVLLTTSLLVYLGHIKVGSWIALTSSLLIFSMLFFINDGIRDIAVMGLIVVLAAAGLLAGKPGTITMGMLILFEIIIYGLLESRGRVTNQLNVTNNFADYFSLGLGILLVTIFQWVVIDRLKKSVQSSENELAERKKFQAQLEEAETRYRGLVESIPLVIYISEPGRAGAWHFVSPQITVLTGFTTQEWIDNPELWYSRVHPDDRERVTEEETQALKEGKMPKLEYRLLTRDEKTIWVYDESLVIIKSDLLQVQGFILDITARKLAEEQLTKRLAELQAVHGIGETLVRESDLQKLIYDTGEQIRTAFNANNVLIALHDPITNLIRFPYDYEEGVLRKDIPIRYGDGLTTRIMEMKKPLLIDQDWLQTTGELNAIYTNNFPILSSFSVPIMTNEQVMGVITLESTEKEFAFSEIDTRPILTIAASLAVAIEKTRLQDSIKSEMEIQEKLIRELESKNEELERFTYTVSHDLKSPLITIRGFLGYLEQDAHNGNFDRLDADLKRISEATDKMHRLLNELLQLSRVGRTVNEKEDVPFEEVLTEALTRVEGQLKEGKVTVQVGSGLPIVHVDRERLVEVIQNLVDNAIKFMGERSAPVIEIGHIMQNGNPTFYVRDNGIGIKPEFHHRIFGLFDKLDPASEGTGVGLALVKRIVEIHGGNVWVESQEGAGATFYFTLG